MESKCVKRRRIDESRFFDASSSLADLVNWKHPQNIAIEYHESLGSTVAISYDELRRNVSIIEDIFDDIEGEFIGIDSDVPGMCIPALMLGINSSRNAFVCLPPSIRLSSLIKNRLKIVYTISLTTTKEVYQEIHIHSTKLFLKKFISPVKSSCKKTFAYAVTTSGTTGRPKVIRVTEKSIIPNIKDLVAIFELSNNDKIAQLTPLTFDPSIIEIFISLSSASCLFITSNDLKNDPASLLTSIRRSRVTVIQSTPSVLMYRWPISTIFKENRDLRIILLGGELLPDPEIFFNSKHHNCRFFNIYGISEVSCWASVTEIFPSSDKSDLGKLLSDTQFKVINENNEIVSDGEGELLIGSDTRICLLDNEKIEEIETPVFRKTGDLVKIEKTGKISFVSRKNRMIKRLGHRINLQYLENYVNRLEIVKKSVAICHPEKQTIHVFFTSKNEIKEDNLKEKLENEVLCCVRELEAAYQPNGVYLIKSFDVNDHGKICFESLRKISENLKVSGEKVDFIGIFDQVWCNYLTMKNCGFISAGGSSIIALQMANEFSEITGIEWPELIGRLLKNETFESCKVYILQANSSFDRIENKVYQTIVKETLDNSLENEKKIELPENSEINAKNEEKCNNKDSQDENSILHENVDVNIVNNSIFKQYAEKSDVNNLISKTEREMEKNNWFWQKCRGRTIFNVKLQQTQIQYLNSLMDPMGICDFKKLSAVERKLCNRDKNLTENFQKNLYKINLQKKYNLSKCIDSSPTIFTYNSSMYTTVCSHSGIICTVKLTESKDSNENTWYVYLPDRIEASVLIVQDFTGIVGCYDGFIYCIHLKSGEIRWKFKTGGAVKCTAVFSIDGERIFFGSYDHTIYCLSAESGVEVWKTIPSNGSISASGVTSKSTNSIFFGTLDGTCVSLNENSGKIQWKNNLKYPIFSSPVISQSTSIIFCDVSGILVAFRLETGEKLWEMNVKGNVFSNLVIQRISGSTAEDLIVTSRDKKVYQFIVEMDCKVHLKRIIEFSSPIIATPWLDRCFIVVVTINGELVIVSRQNGNFIGEYRVDGEVYSSPVTGGDFIAVGCRDNNFYIFSFE